MKDHCVVSLGVELMVLLLKNKYTTSLGNTSIDRFWKHLPGTSTKVSCRFGALEEPLMTAVLNKLVVEPIILKKTKNVSHV